MTDRNKQAVAVFDKMAEVYRQKYMDLELYNDTFDFFCDHVSAENAEILELACGPGNITRYLLQKRPDFQVLATDLAPNMLEIARQNNQTAAFQLLDSRKIGELKKQYDAIICGFGLPYLSKEEAVRLIQDASARLKPNGLLYLSTMEDDYEKSGTQKSSAGDEVYMYYHEAGYLTEAIRENNMEIILLERKDFPSETKTTDLILIAQLKEQASERL